VTIQKFLNEKEVAARWGMSVKTLQAWRISGNGPKYAKLGGKVRYPIESVEAFEAESMTSSTSEACA